MSTQEAFSRGLRVTGVLIAISIVWLWVLPWLGEQPVARDFIARMEQAGIDPSAMYYSELETLDQTESKFRELEEDYPYLFWHSK